MLFEFFHLTSAKKIDSEFQILAPVCCISSRDLTVRCSFLEVFSKIKQNSQEHNYAEPLFNNDAVL